MYRLTAVRGPPCQHGELTLEWGPDALVQIRARESIDERGGRDRGGDPRRRPWSTCGANLGRVLPSCLIPVLAVVRYHLAFGRRISEEQPHEFHPQ